MAKATLKLYVNSVAKAGSFNVDFVNGSWEEKTITSTLAPALGKAIASSVPVTAASANDYVLIDVTTAVQDWLNGSEPNDGIALLANSGFSATFDSKENSAQSHPAELDIVYASGNGTITGVTTASGSGLTGGGTSGDLQLSLLQSCSSKQILQWTGSAWACASAGTGTISGVTAGADLTGGGTSGAVTINLDTTKVPLLRAANAFTANQTFTGNGIWAQIGDMGCGIGFVGVSLFGGGNGCLSYSILGDTAGNLYLNRPTGGTMRFREGNGDEFAIGPGGNIWAGGRVTAASFSGDGSKLSNIAPLAGNNIFSGFNWFQQNTEFSGNGETAVIGNMGCGANSAGIAFTGVNCANYALLDYNGQTILNRTLGQTMSFREGNGPDQMTINSGGGVTMNTGANPTIIQGNGAQSTYGCCGATLLVTDYTSDPSTQLFVAWAPNVGSANCIIDTSANFQCTGPSSSVVSVKDGSRHVALYATQSPENWFEDYGSGTLANGVATLTLDPVFAETINTAAGYHVFVTPNGDCRGLYVTNKTATSFEVHELGGGQASIDFDFKIIAKRKGYENVRLADQTERYNRMNARAAEVAAAKKP